MKLLSIVPAVLLACTATIASAQVDARMFRFPAVSASHIAFTYAGDIWIVPKSGGLATRLSSPPGEETWPRFSPDGSRIAFSANYDGNTDVYVVPTLGGDPVRLTFHPMEDRVVGWHPDGKRVLFASGRESGRQRYNQFYLVDAEGGAAAKLSVPYGEFATYSPDAQHIAYTPKSQAMRTWKRYRGGWASDVWTFDPATFASRPLAVDPANDEYPMWHGDFVYFLSDRGAGERSNVWAVDRRSGAVRQVTDFREYDASQPSLGPNDIVFQAGGALYLLDLATERVSEVKVQVVTDRTTLKARAVKVGTRIDYSNVSPTAKRAVFQARGDVFTVPGENGPVLNLTRSPGAAERYPRWSPDGGTIAYWSDRSGEYELTVRPADGGGTERRLTTLGPGYRYPPFWSPDSKRIAFIDDAGRVHVADASTGAEKEIDRSPLLLTHDQLQHFVIRWSPDSRWVTWSRQALATNNNAIFVYDTKDETRHQLTSGYFNEYAPVFDPEDRYLFFYSDRQFEPVYGNFDNGWTYANPTRIVAMTLRADVPSPLAPENDVEVVDGPPDDARTSTADKSNSPDGGAAPNAKPAAEATAQRKEATPAGRGIDVEGAESRIVVLPPAPGNYGLLAAVKGKLLYQRLPRTGSAGEKSPVLYLDLEEREEKTVIDDADVYDAALDGKKLLVGKDGAYAMIELKEGQKLEKKMNTGDMEMIVDPSSEWRQMFTDAFRFERDHFYDPNMHGVDWAAMRSLYGRLIDQALTRWDVSYVLGEFIGELNSSHTYRSGGDVEKPIERGVGMLGIDWDLSDGLYRVKHIVRGGPWDTDVRAPLAEPGLNVVEGDYVLAVNGAPLDVTRDPWASFQGLGNKVVTLTVNRKPTFEGARQVTVKCLDSEVELRYREWIEVRRRRVDEASGGRVGYVYVQSTGVEAQNELVRQFMGQWKREALVIDERFNSGGQVPDRFIELLNRPILSYWATRYGEDLRWPPVAHRGPKVMLINGWSGSGGDAFPLYFREAGMGPLIGTRTWGGLIGISGSPELVDGGTVTVPDFRMFDVNGAWFAEGHGVDPDIVVEEDPTQLARGIDPQLERGIQEAMARLKDQKPAPTHPGPERRTAPQTAASGAR